MDLIDLDECVINALELFTKSDLPQPDFSEFKRPLVVGSGNAAVTGRIIFEHADAVFADEGTYKTKLESIPDIDGVILISASGGKHAPIIAEEVKKLGKKVILLTNNENALAKNKVDETFVYPKNPEPYTYNTSTYMSIILSITKEDPNEILKFINEKVAPLVPDFKGYDAYYIIVPTELDATRELFMTKFDELFGPKISGRVFTPEQTKHAKTVVPSETECFLSFGYVNEDFGKHRRNIPLPKNAGPAAIMAIAYYIIGQIQKQNEQYFKNNIENYAKRVSEIFGQEIKPFG